ncbi:unnamed protein product [Hymenolepis diminuta]|uniref:PlsC domain-containing protein n=1 Tax=Hymenolepis diminuta TaxID=6216 RepID=A0A0R3SMP7_HYMDI|nr:unnamed protein product [Hymenolepis diminuta]
MLTLTGFFGSLFMMGPFLPLVYVAPSLFLLLMDCGVLLNGVLRIQVRLFGDNFVLPGFSSTEDVNNVCSSEGDDPSSGTSSILVLNHRTRLDWIFALSLGRYARHFKIVLKWDLAKLPGVGWAMQLDSFIFLKRKIALDLARMQQAVRYLLKLQGSAHVRHIFLFTNKNKQLLNIKICKQIDLDREIIDCIFTFTEFILRVLKKRLLLNLSSVLALIDLISSTFHF